MCRAGCGGGRRRGGALVEFALVAPLLFLLVFGMIDLGRMVMVQQALTNASREAGRRAGLGVSRQTVEQTALDYLKGCGIKGANVAVSPDPAAARFGDALDVTISVRFDQVSWLSTPYFLQDATLKARSQMRSEQPN